MARYRVAELSQTHFRLLRMIAICSCMSCVVVNAGFAAEADFSILTESEFLSDIPSVATVTRLPQPRSETPAAVTIIDRGMIRASGARDLVGIFRFVPGFQVAYPRGHRPTITYHGLGDEFSRRMQILIDGRSVYDAMFGHVSWSAQAIAIDDIERIEVTRGPNTATYGANAFLGTINIITQHAIQQNGTDVKLTAGNHDIRDGLLRYGVKYDDHHFRMSVGYFADDGIEGLPDDNQTRFINFRGDLTLNQRDTLLLQVGISRADPEEGFFNNAEVPPNASQVDTDFQQIQWERSLKADESFKLQFYHNYRDLGLSYLTDPIDLGPPIGAVQVPVNFDHVAHRYDLEFQHTLSPAMDWRIVWGAGIREDQVTSQSYLGARETIKTDSSRLFANAEWLVRPDSIINVGAMLEDTDFTGTDFSPRIALNHHLNPSHTLRAIWSKARRIPSYLEEFGDQQFTFQGINLQQTYSSQGGLQPEVMTSYELGYLGQFPGINTTLDVRVYRDRISDFITEVVVPASDPDGGALSYRNDGEVTVDGIDFELTYRPVHNTRLIMTYSLMHASGSEPPADATGNQRQRLQSVPDYSGSILAMHGFAKDWYASFGYYFVDDMLWLSDGDVIEKYDRLDLRLARKIQIDEMRGELALVVQNIGDDYVEFKDEQFFETRTFVTLEMKF